MSLVTSYDQAKIDDLLADLQAWASANLAPITEPLAVNAQNAANAAQAEVDTLDGQVVKLTGDQTITGVKSFTDPVNLRDDNVFIGAGAGLASGVYVAAGSLGSATEAWVDARAEDLTNVPLNLRAKGSGRIYARSMFEALAGIQLRQVNVATSTYTASLADEMIAVGVTCTVTLPNNAAGLFGGKRYLIANTGSGVVSLSGVPLVGVSATIPAGNSVRLWSDGTNYYREGDNGTLICTSSTKPTVNLYAGLKIYETDKQRECIWSGSAWYVTTHSSWLAWTPTFGNITGGDGLFKYRFTANRLEIMGYFTAGTITAAGQGTMTVPSGLTLTSAGVQRETWFPSSGGNTLAVLTGNTNSITLNLTAGPNGANFAAGNSIASSRITGAIFEMQETYF